MTFYPSMKTGGGTVEMAPETALGTAGTYVEQRLTGTDPTFPTDTRQAIDVPFTGHRHWGTRENQVTYEAYREGALTIPTYLARATGTLTDLPQTVQHFRAAGCNIGNEVANTINAYTDTGQWTMTNDATLGSGSAILVDLDGGGTADTATYPLYPVLCSAYDTGTNVFTPAMDIPTPSGTLASSTTELMHVITPRVRELPATSTNAFRVISYYQHTADQCSFVYTGCAVQSFADVTIEPNMPIEIVPTYHVADIAGPSDATIATEAFQDLAKMAIIGCDTRCHVEMTTFADPITSRVTANLISAVWTPGIGCIVKPGYGGSTSLNGVGKYFATYTGAKLVVKLAMDKTYWTNWIARSAATDLFVGIVQPATTTASTAFGLWLPKCKIKGSPQTSFFSEDTLDVTLTLEPTTPAYGTDESVTSAGMAPWVLGISGASS